MRRKTPKNIFVLLVWKLQNPGWWGRTLFLINMTGYWQQSKWQCLYRSSLHLELNCIIKIKLISTYLKLIESFNFTMNVTSKGNIAKSRCFNMLTTFVIYYQINTRCFMFWWSSVWDEHGYEINAQWMVAIAKFTIQFINLHAMNREPYQSSNARLMISWAKCSVSNFSETDSWGR